MTAGEERLLIQQARARCVYPIEGYALEKGMDLLTYLTGQALIGLLSSPQPRPSELGRAAVSYAIETLDALKKFTGE